MRPVTTTPLRLAVGLLAALCGMSAVPSTAAPAKVEDTIAQRALACAACHGKEGRATPDGYFPRIAGKPAGYLANQLVNFREGRRQSPAMTYLVGHMSDPYLKELADYFAGLHLPYTVPLPPSVPAAVLERGQRLVLKGDPGRQLPACVACHGQALTGVQPGIPGLLGLPRDYLNAQFGAWRTGTRRAAAPDCMATISSRLQPDDIAAMTAWLAAQPLAADMKPAAAASGPLPLDCGSASQH